MKNHQFIKRIKDTILDYDMIVQGDRVLVAVSGGADSVSLLYALSHVKDSLGIELVVANMDHGLRGKESEDESEFVFSLADKLGIEVAHKKEAVGDKGKKGLSLEEKARERRYAFFREAALAKGCSVVATGHNMDDQAETVLMKVLYGASLAGLSGIPPVRDMEGVDIVRPLIRTKRRDIEAFLKAEELSFVDDSSNRDMRFRRNHVRYEVLPFLERYNPRIRRSLSNLADSLRQDLELLEEAREGEVEKAGPRISLSVLLAQPKSINREIFKKLFADSGGNIKKLTYRHWMYADKLIRYGRSGDSIDLPGGVVMSREGRVIAFRSSA